jgi:hypothetical protein
VIEACRQWLTQVLGPLVGGPGNVHHKAAEASGDLPLPNAVCLLGARERTKRDGSLVGSETLLEQGVRRYRRRVWQRTVPIDVRIEHKTEAEAEAIVNALELAAAAGLDDGAGNRVLVRCGAVVWAPNKALGMDRARGTVQLEFEGGVYRDKTVPLYRAVVVEGA